jgi:hypothetical protein
MPWWGRLRYRSPNTLSAPGGRPGGLALLIAERRRAVAVGGGGPGSPARAVTERGGSIVISRGGASGPAAGIAEGSLVLGCGSSR